MSISPISGIIYTNQNMQIPAAKQIEYQNKLDLQNVMAAEVLNEKEREVEEVRPTEESYKIDPENEHEKDKQDEQSGEKEEETELLKGKKGKKNRKYLLDIKV